MRGHKKLSDFLTDEKKDRFSKENTWVLCSGANIAWVVGMRIDERYKVTSTTKNVYFVRIK
ncbi:MAG: tRNA lysidine(34) synthetase TilS C-terminal domain-containing protein [Owenweeksia sp.]|nr:tRNA lysidine(34) synthetase TilS C-terminal domain-containing protein [Owenweeksia sp.]